MVTDLEPLDDQGFESITDGIQKILDFGAEALSEAESKLEEAAELDVDSEEYAQLVQEVKDAQARAGEAFGQAEELIKAANELLANNSVN